MTTRNLTYDQRKAAEAAFQGLPMDPQWSEAARGIYDGIRNALERAGTDPFIWRDEKDKNDVVELTEGEAVRAPHVQEQPVGPVGGEEMTSGRPEAPRPESDDPEDDLSAQSASDAEGGNVADHAMASPHERFSVASREEAVQAGLVVDVTPQAHLLGLSLSVGLTKPVWEMGVTASEKLPEEAYAGRVRDILIALRLHMTTSPLLPGVMQFPALLPFPPEPVAKVFVLCAVFHRDRTTTPALTVALPHEIAALFSN
ncbi:MAG: hypothetical protein ACREI3_10210 [Nitrospirales bacterium]